MKHIRVEVEFAEMMVIYWRMSQSLDLPKLKRSITEWELEEGHGEECKDEE